ncbi:MAG: response regulator transcription factor [Halieaceae bacterium]
MEQLFVTANGQLLERWNKAFPKAIAVVAVSDVPEATAAPRGVLWLDTRNLEPVDAARDLQDAVSFGWPVVVMAAVPNETDAFQALTAGAVGYCHVKAAPEQLREIALVVEHGGVWMLPELLQRFLALSSRVAPAPAPVEPELNALTSRELMVAEQVAKGATNREIAETLDITERTVKAHLSSIFEKLAVRDRVQLALAMNNIPTYTTVN